MNGSTADRAAPRYSVQLEVAGPLAMFARPDTGGTPTSYPVPTWSAAKGMFESIAFFADGAAWICPTSVEVCRPIGQPRGRVHYQRYTTSYGGPLRKAALAKKGLTPGGSSMQLFATLVSDVCYRLHGIVVGATPSGRVNARHHLQDLFDRRLKRGQCFRSLRLGWSECTCSYWGPFREGQTEVDDALSLDIPSMLLSVWGKPVTRGDETLRYEPAFRQDVRISRGVLEYGVPDAWCGERDRKEGAHAQ